MRYIIMLAITAMLVLPGRFAAAEWRDYGAGVLHHRIYEDRALTPVSNFQAGVHGVHVVPAGLKFRLYVHSFQPGHRYYVVPHDRFYRHNRYYLHRRHLDRYYQPYFFFEFHDRRHHFPRGFHKQFRDHRRNPFYRGY